jgi:hypothetical protein
MVLGEILMDFAGVEFLSVLIFLYAETHYSFKGIYSRLKKKEPEIIADLPHRIKPNAPIPILIFIKDAHRFPICLQQIHVELMCHEESQVFNFEYGSQPISSEIWHQILEINPNRNFNGATNIDVTIKYTVNDKKRQIKNDNYACTSHAPFQIYISEHELPKSNGWHFGEFHCHTIYTSDQVEFGAPLQATAHLARTMGLSFFCATDHSYDLDDDPNSYLSNHPSLPKWKKFQHEVKQLNETNSQFVIVPGEEVSAGNHRNRNVHFLILNHPEFLPGDGDSAEKWLQTKPNLSIQQILQEINSKALAFAAHPETKPPFLESLLVRRGKWENQDYQNERLDGLQIWNGSASGLREGEEKWVQLLLQGRRLFICGGNDAHGNFNRFRQIGFPFFTMRENHNHLFGKVRTGVYLENGLSLDGILEAFKRGRMVMTDGPFVDFCVRNEIGQIARMGDSIFGKNFTVEIECHSTPEFGQLRELRIYRGNLIEKKETLFTTSRRFSETYDQLTKIEITEKPNPSYLRAELYSETNGKTLKCLTNPIWLNHGSK